MSLLLDVWFVMAAAEPTTSSKTNSAPDFLLEWYKLQREHELELNKATLAYELELAKLFVLLNGGAAGAFLTLIGAVWKEQRHPSLGWVCVAIVAWLIGLVVAAFAIRRAYEIQRDYSTAYRYRRQLEELRRIEELKKLGVKVEADDLGIMADKTKIGEPQKPLAEKIKDAANCMRKKASAKSERIWLPQYSAVMMFVLGSLFALVAFYVVT